MSKRKQRPTAKGGTAVVRALLGIRADAVTGTRTETRIDTRIAPVTVADCRAHGLNARVDGAAVVVTWPAR